MKRETQKYFTIKNGGVKLIDNGGYKTTGDAALLAECAKPKAGASVLDAGVGAGGVALCMLADNPKLKITGIDASEEMLSDAWANALANGREIDLVMADVMNWRTSRTFDCVVTNPPFFSGTARRDKAHHNVDICKWTAACVKRLKARGMFYCIVAPDVMDQVIAALAMSKCGGITIQPFATSRGIGRMVISGRQGVKSPAKLLESRKI